eukprot:scaffold300074_cov33-Tisochrysis_lutea.AAC.2
MQRWGDGHPSAGPTLTVVMHVVHRDICRQCVQQASTRGCCPAALHVDVSASSTTMQIILLHKAYAQRKGGGRTAESCHCPQLRVLCAGDCECGPAVERKGCDDLSRPP